MGRRVGHESGNTRRLVEFYFKPLSFYVNVKSVYVQACSQGVVGEGSTADQPLQGQTAAARWLGKPQSTKQRAAEMYFAT